MMRTLPVPPASQTSFPNAEPQFDAYASAYDEALNRGLALSGEAKEYFAEGRARWMRQCLAKLGHAVRTALDFGCGTGSATPYLLRELELAALTGVDVSEQSLQLARAQYVGEHVKFSPVASLSQAPESFDFATCNGVFHHIPITDRAASARSVFEAVKPGGYFAFWENNKWNPMVHYIMSRVPFDADAIMLWPHEARRMLRAAGFEIVRTDYVFIFPGALAKLRFLEPLLCKLPLGGQYQILCRRPA